MTKHSKDPIPTPASRETITAEWLTQALSVNYPGTEVKSVYFGSEIYGTGAKLRLLLDYNDAGHRHGLPPTMWIKGPFHEYSRNIHAAFERETLFYRDISPQVNIRSPKGYFAGDGVVLIEDLLAANASFGDPATPLTVAMVRDVLEIQARYHALWWQSPKLDILGKRGGSLKEDGVIERLMQPDSWNRAMAMERSRGVPAALRDRDRVWGGIERLLAVNDTLPECLLHGDPHIGNMYFVDGRVGLLDWQRLMRGPWIWDLAYMLAGSLAPHDRRNHEKELLSYYLEQLASHGVAAPSFDETWELYRINLFYGMVWVVVPDGTQTEEAIYSVSSRFAAAIDELWCFD